MPKAAAVCKLIYRATTVIASAITLVCFLVQWLVPHGLTKGQPLYYTITRNSDNITILNLIIEKRADINSLISDNHPWSALFCFEGLRTALHKAARLSKLDVVRYLTSEGVDLDMKDANGHTALDCAKMAGH